METVKEFITAIKELSKKSKIMILVGIIIVLALIFS